VALYQAVFNLRRTHVDANPLRALATSIHAARARLARRLALAQADNRLLTQFAEYRLPVIQGPQQLQAKPAVQPRLGRLAVVESKGNDALDGKQLIVAGHLNGRVAACRAPDPGVAAFFHPTGYFCKGATKVFVARTRSRGCSRCWFGL
jgi:hypothetical protein